MVDEAFWSQLPLGPGVELLRHDARGIGALAKPAGVLSHPNEPRDQPRSLLACAYDLEAECFCWDVGGARRRLWLLNRLDGATSGVILVAADGDLARTVKTQFARQHIQKIYVARVFGRMAQSPQVWTDRLAVQKQGGQIRTKAAGNIPAETAARSLEVMQGAFATSLLRLEPRTGRSHQLRVQCAKRGLPIVGDQTYGDFTRNRALAKVAGTKRLFLHSLETSFSYEVGGRRHSFSAAAPLPPEFSQKY